MYNIAMDVAHGGGGLFEMHLRDVAQAEAKRLTADSVAFSEEAMAAFKEAAIEPLKDGTFTLERLESRINTVQMEIAEVWNSALPEDEKVRQISAKENEIALLRAGQFTFAKAGFSRRA